MTAPEYLTFAVTGDAPLRLKLADWPVLAEAKIQADGWRCRIGVRQHADGRAHVYGIIESRTALPYGKLRAGERLPQASTSDLVAALRRVWQTIADGLPAAPVSPWPRLLQACLEQLPPVSI